MIPTIDINLAGIKFTFNCDAYSMLKEYFSSLETFLRKNTDDASELMADIEARCAELLCVSHDPVSYLVSSKDVADIINRLGSPEEVAEFCFTDSAAVESRTEPEEQKRKLPPVPPKVRRKLFRTPWDKMLGGVCGGLGNYLGMDVTYVRLAWVLVTIITATVPCLAYLVLWIIVPEARTPLQRLELQGESPSLGNIGTVVTEAFKSGLSESEPRTKGGRIVKFCAGVFKVVLCFFGLLFIPVVLGLLAILVASIVAVMGVALGIEDGWIAGFMPEVDYPVAYVCLMIFSLISVCLLLSVPIYAALTTLSSSVNISRRMKICWMSALLISVVIAMALYYSVKAIGDFNAII